MPSTVHAHALRLEFAAGALVQRNLSGAAFSSPDWLWLAGDEACGLERLQRLPALAGETLRFGASQHFALADFLDLPGSAADEADLEGLALADGYLWLLGSHSIKRKNAKPGRYDADNARRLAKLGLDPNRRLLARIPLENDGAGRPHPVRKAADGRSALRLKGDALDNELTRLLANDPHLAPFLAIPGKDNGLDIEGLAVMGKRLLLGLRGPVLRGWSGILEIALEERGGQLRLAAMDKDGTKLRKHFFQLDGLGLRDLHFAGDDLYLLAGPTMVLDGAIRLFCWPGARGVLAANREACRFHEGLLAQLDLPHGRGCDRAEALCLLPAALAGPARQWLALYDAPAPARCEADGTVWGDLLG